MGHVGRGERVDDKSQQEQASEQNRQVTVQQIPGYREFSGEYRGQPQNEQNVGDVRSHHRTDDDLAGTLLNGEKSRNQLGKRRADRQYRDSHDEMGNAQPQSDLLRSTYELIGADDENGQGDDQQ